MNTAADEPIRPVWAEVDLGRIKENVRILSARNGNRALMAVVKADAYGHGAIPVAQACLAAGATWLGVATPEEGLALRRAGIAARILVLGAFFPGQEHAFADHRLTATAATPEGIEALCKLAEAGCRVYVHLKIDTGMGRLGFLPADALAAARKLAASNVCVEGLYTHLATADEPDTTYALEQLSRFRNVRMALDAARIRPRWHHAGNSAALLQLPLEEFNLTRAGIGIYGLGPSPALLHRVNVQPAMSLLARAVAVRRLPASSPISYGAAYVTTRPTTIVALPLGYADGYTRRLSHKAFALLGGRRFPVVGNICMDQCMVDVADYPARVGEEVVLLGRQGEEEITADELAEASGTINYEIICAIGARVPRLYQE